MIINSFDNQSEPLFGPANYNEKSHFTCDICILTFSHEILTEMKQLFNLKISAAMQAANGSIPIYLFEYEGETIGVCLSGIGATLAGTNVVEINWLIGATKFIMFGSAGSLNHTKTDGKYIVPTEAYRDEGMSYHYAPPNDYIQIKNSRYMESFFCERKLPYTTGRIWTTDAFYRETRNQVKKRQDEGCIAVEMELAGVQAVCDFHGFELYDFLVAGDILDTPIYQTADLHRANHDLDKLWIALQLALKLKQQ